MSGESKKGNVPPPPPWNSSEPGVPVRITSDGVTSEPILVGPPVLDEEQFANECASRINAFISTYPREARHLFAAFLPYEHELAQVHADACDSEDETPPGVTVGNLVAGILQTQHGTGWVLRPVFGKDPILGMTIVRLCVVRQTPANADSE